MYNTISVNEMNEIKEEIIKKGYPVKLTNLYIEGNKKTMAYALIREYGIKDDYIVCHGITGDTIRIDNRGITLLLSAESRSNFASKLKESLVSANLYDDFVEICNKNGVEVLSKGVANSIKEELKRRIA